MSKIKLKDNIYIVGIDNQLRFMRAVYFYNGIAPLVKVIYSGKTSEISEELAKECVKNWRVGGLYHNYKVTSQYEEYMFKSAKKSIQSACPEEYCIIYKIK